jgi:hypothetical protein
VTDEKLRHKRWLDSVTAHTPIFHIPLSQRCHDGWDCRTSG